MSASPQEIGDAITEFVVLTEDDALSTEDRTHRLRRSLDRLALIQHDVSYTFDERDFPETPRKGYNALRKVVSEHFPELGHYNTPSSITQQIAEAEIEVGDAIDDITDIAIELYDVPWRLDHTSADDAIWCFSSSYSTHWEQHLRELQLCLQRIAAGHEDAV
jgi:Domain of unknown function (DUF5063)